MTDNLLDSFLERVSRLDALYTHIYVRALAVRVDDKWVLLHASIILTPGFRPESPPAPYPEDLFLLVDDFREISDLETLIHDARDGLLNINGKKIRFQRGGEKDVRWFSISHRDNLPEISEYHTLAIRTTGVSTNKILDSVWNALRVKLESSYQREYHGIEDLTEALIGRPIGYNNNCTIEYFAPSWCRIDRATMQGGRLTFSITCPLAICEDLTLEFEGMPTDEEDISRRYEKKLERFDVRGLECFDKNKTMVTLHLTDDKLSSEPEELVIGSPIGRPTEPSKREATIIVRHKSREPLARSRIPLDEHDPNPNNVRLEHFERAVRLAEKCQSEPHKLRRSPKVGAVVVKNGEIISEAFRGEIGRGDHAEYIALERKGRDIAEIRGADLLTTLEPCTTRSHDKRPCVSWVKSRGIRKVWIGTLDYNPNITGIGELELQRDGILIGRFPDHLTKQIIDTNEDFFDEIEKAQPRLSQEEQSRERDLILTTIREKLSQANALYATLVMLYAQFIQPEPLLKQDVLSLLKGRLSRDGIDYDAISAVLPNDPNQLENLRNEVAFLRRALDLALAISDDDADVWLQMALTTYSAGEYGIASHAARVAAGINATMRDAWELLAKSELKLFEYSDSWPYGYTMRERDFTPGDSRSRAWLSLAKAGVDKPENALRCLIRALQLGNRSHVAVSLTRDLLRMTISKEIDQERSDQIAVAWCHIAEIWDSNENRELAHECKRKAEAVGAF